MNYSSAIAPAFHHLVMITCSILFVMFLARLLKHVQNQKTWLGLFEQASLPQPMSTAA